MQNYLQAATQWLWLLAFGFWLLAFGRCYQSRTVIRGGASNLLFDIGIPGVPYDCHPERSEGPAGLTASIHCHPDCYGIVILSEGAANHPASESKDLVFLLKSGGGPS